MPRGRGQPTKYRPKYCQTVVENAEAGYSLTSCAAVIGVSRETVSEWASVHPDFSVAVKRAKALATRKWEQRAADLADVGGSGGQVAMAIFQLKNHAPEDFKDKIETVHSGTLTLAALVEQAHQLRADSAKVIEHDVGSEVGNAAGVDGRPLKSLPE